MLRGPIGENFVPVSVISNGWPDLTDHKSKTDGVPLSSSERPQIHLLQYRRRTGNYDHQGFTLSDTV